MKKISLSLREIVMIWTAILLLSASVCVYLLIIPSSKAYNAAKSSLRDAEFSETAVRAELARLSELRAEAGEIRKELEELMPLYDDFTQLEDIEYGITNYLLTHSNIPTDILIEYIPKDAETAGGYLPAKTQGAWPDGQSGAKELIKFSVRVSTTGTLTDMLALLDYVNGSRSYRLIGMSADSGDGNPSGSYMLEVALKY